MQHFDVAPMSTRFRVVSIALLLLPVGLGYAATIDPIVMEAMTAATALIVVVYAAIALAARPTGFDVTDDAVVVRFPIRRLTVPRDAITHAEVVRLLDPRVFGLRVGAGGFLGVFGWLFGQHGWVAIVATREDGLVYLKREGRMPLVISPADPERFVAAVQPGA